uniref:DUF834 domain-containing protein n=1 Tax=Oryza nivara TaxID=4536 RepID=A0A0E0FFH1_ORYNI
MEGEQLLVFVAGSGRLRAGGGVEAAEEDAGLGEDGHPAAASFAAGISSEGGDCDESAGRRRIWWLRHRRWPAELRTTRAPCRETWSTARSGPDSRA